MIWLLLLSCAFGQSPTPQQRTREVLDLWVAGKYDAIHAMFDAKMRTFPVATYREQSEQLKSLGEIKKIGEPVVHKQSEHTTVLMRIDFASSALNFSVTWNKGGEISGTWFRPAA